MSNAAQATQTERPNLLDFDKASLRSFFESMGEPAFRATQVLQWMHQRGVRDVNEMTNLSLTLRERLQEAAVMTMPEITWAQCSKDGTRKWVLRLWDGQSIETVFIPEGRRGTLCISSQVGCALDCSFCATGKQGFSRHLDTAEIIAQLRIAIEALSEDKTNREHCVTNVVMMGMGEPLLNYDAVLRALSLMMDDDAYGLSKYRVTLSTSGVVPAMFRLAEESPVSLAVSLHAPNDALRNELVPINKKYPLAELLKACRAFFKKESRRQVTFEYVMLAGVNDRPSHARELLALLKGLPCKMNLIPFNPVSFADYQCSSKADIERFQQILMQGGVHTIVRKTRGQDIDAACGQLVGKVQDKTRRQAYYQAQALKGMQEDEAS